MLTDVADGLGDSDAAMQEQLRTAALQQARQEVSKLTERVLLLESAAAVRETLAQEQATCRAHEGEIQQLREELRVAHASLAMVLEKDHDTDIAEAGVDDIDVFPLFAARPMTQHVRSLGMLSKGNIRESLSHNRSLRGRILKDTDSGVWQRKASLPAFNSSYMRNSTEMREKQERLRIALELQTFIDTANAPIFGVDAKGLVNEWNNKAVEITRFTREEVLGQDFVQEYITEEYRESVKAVLDDALRGKETANFEFAIYTKDKRRVDVLLNATTRRDLSGGVVGMIGVGQDITRMRALMQQESIFSQAQAANEARARFLSNMSHEMRTPLNVVIGLSLLSCVLVILSIFFPFARCFLLQFVSHSCSFVLLVCIVFLFQLSSR